MDSIFKGIQKLNDSDNKQLMFTLFKYNRALQDKFATHHTDHLPSSGIYVQPSDDMIATWKRKEQDHHGVYYEQRGLAWRQTNSQFMTRQTTLKLDKDFKVLDEVGTEVLWNRLAMPQDAHYQESNAPSAPLRSTGDYGCAQGRE